MQTRLGPLEAGPGPRAAKIIDTAQLCRDSAALASGKLRRSSFPNTAATLSPHEPL